MKKTTQKILVVPFICAFLFSSVGKVSSALENRSDGGKITEQAQTIGSENEKGARPAGQQKIETFVGSEVRGGKNNETESGKVVPGKLIVKTKEGKKLSEIGQLNKKYKVKKTSKFFADAPSLEEGMGKAQKERESVEKMTDDPERENRVRELDERIAGLKKLDEKLENRQKRALAGEKNPRLENIYTLEMPEENNVLLIAEQYGKNPAVEYAEPVREMKIATIPNDPYFSSSNSWGQGYDDLWGLKKIKADSAWDVSKGEGAIVAVIDTGLDYNHEDISGNVLINAGEIPGNGLDDNGNGYVDDVYGWDFSNNDNDPMDDNGHGTHVSGTIAATGNNNLGVVGMAPQAKIMVVKSLNQSGSGYTDQLANSIIYATNNGADVINASWGGAFTSQIIRDAVDYAHSRGSIFVAVAGNTGFDGAAFSPANLENSIAVSAVDHNDVITTFSTYGANIDVAAPGGESGQTADTRSILSLRAAGTDIYGDGSGILNDKYYRARGTSMAAPHSAGLAALIVSLHPEFSNEEARQVIRKSADDLGETSFDEKYGFGRINAQAATGMNSACSAQITAPKVNAITNGENNIVVSGTADCSSGLGNYKLEYAASLTAPWMQIGGAYLTAVTNGKLAQWNNPALGRYLLKLTVTDTSGQSFQDIAGPIYVDPSFKESGWPFATDAEIVSSPLVADLEGDGQNELIFTSGDGKVCVLDKNGQPKNGWPVASGSFMAGHYDPAVGDVDGNGKLEVVVKTITASVSLDQINIYKHDGTVLAGWPKSISQLSIGALFGSGRYTSPILADLDNDGASEIIVNSVGGWTYVFEGNGSDFSGWPKKVVDDNFTLIYSNPAVGDINGDGFAEIIIKAINETSYNSKGILYAFDRNGNLLSGWPKDIHNGSTTSPILGDINNDGKKEVICSSFIKGSSAYLNEYVIYVFDYLGNYLPGWPTSYAAPGDSPNAITGGLSVADLNKDGGLEILSATNSTWEELHVFKNNGQLLWKASPMVNWIYNMYSAPVVADINGDNELEIMIAKYQGMPEYTGRIFVYDRNGTEKSALNKIIPDQLWISPTVEDLDNDGKSEIVAGSMLGKIYVWDTNGVNSRSLMPWPVFQGNIQRTGFSMPQKDALPPTIPADLSAAAISSSQINLSWTVSTDNCGVTGYRIFRDGVEAGTSAVNSYSDTGLSPATTYNYTVSAYDAAENNSSQSVPASATTPPAQTNIITNGDFESGTTPWRFYSNGSATFANNAVGHSSAHAAHMTIAAPGTNVQLYQFNIALNANTKYRLNFKAYSNTGHDLQVKFIKHGSPYTDYRLGAKEFNLTNSWQNFSVDFTAGGFTGTVTDGRLMFWLAPYAAANDQYFIDDVVLTSL